MHNAFSKNSKSSKTIQITDAKRLYNNHITVTQNKIVFTWILSSENFFVNSISHVFVSSRKMPFCKK